MLPPRIFIQRNESVIIPLAIFKQICPRYFESVDLCWNVFDPHISFLMPTITHCHIIAYNHTYLFSYSSRGQESKTSLTGLKSSWWQDKSPGSSEGEKSVSYLFQLFAFLVSWPLPQTTSSSVSIVTSTTSSVPPAFFLERLLQFSWTHPDNPG